jgi:hypothetical protein
VSTVTIDARRTRAAEITVPDAGAKPLSATIGYLYDPAGTGVGLSLDSFAGLRMAHLGPQVSGLRQTWNGQWAKGDDAEYDVATTASVRAVQGAKVRHFEAAELATVTNSLGASAPGKTGALTVWGDLPEDSVLGTPVARTLPRSRTLYLSTSDRIRWTLDFEQYGNAKDAEGRPIPDAYYTLGDPRALTPGKTYRNTFNRAVFGPHVSSEFGLFREGNSIYGYLPLFADSAGHAGSSDFTSVTTTLYRNGTEVGTNKDPLFGEEAFKVPSGDAEYRLTTSVRRAPDVADVSSRIDASWTFRSKRPSRDDVARLSASTVRFGAATAADSRAPAVRAVTVPVTVEGPARGTQLRSLAVWVSYDQGRTWKRTPVVKNRIMILNPVRGQSVSFRAELTDKKGNKASVSVYDAYYGK